MDRAECRTQDAEFSGPQILGSRILCHDRRLGRGGDPGLYPKPRTGRSAIGSVRAEDLSRPESNQSIVLTSLKTAFGGSQSNLQLCWRLLAAQTLMVADGRPRTLLSVAHSTRGAGTWPLVSQRSRKGECLWRGYGVGVAGSAQGEFDLVT